MRLAVPCRLLVSLALLLGIHVQSAFAAPRSMHVFVALADNTYQGIVPVARQLGNGDDPDHNLYWVPPTAFARSSRAVRTKADLATDSSGGRDPKIPAGGGADLVAYVGHDGLMDFQLTRPPVNHNRSARPAIILACASRYYFSEALRASGAYPLLWTTNLMAPEAYTLEVALSAWIRGESDGEIPERAAAACARYQKCSLVAARKLFATGC